MGEQESTYNRLKSMFNELVKLDAKLQDNFNGDTVVDYLYTYDKLNIELKKYDMTLKDLKDIMDYDNNK